MEDLGLTHVSTRRAAECLSVCPNTVRKMVRRGDLEAIRICRSKMVVSMASIERFIDRRKVTGACTP